MLNIRRAASTGTSPLRVSDWPVRRKIVLVLALPVILAGVFGGLRVHSELSAASDYSVTQRRVTVIAPALGYLGAVERLTLPTDLSDALGDGQADADQAYDVASSQLKQSASNARLTSDQAALVASMITSGDALRSGSGTGSTADPSVLLSDLARKTNTLIDSTADAQASSGKRTSALVQAVDGRLSLTQQQLLITAHASESGTLGSTWLSAEIGVEGSKLASLKVLLPRNHYVSAITSANAVRLGSAAGGTGVKQLDATPDLFKKYDGLTSTQLVKIDTTLAQLSAASRQNAFRDAAIIIGALLASLALALAIARLLIRPIRRVRADALAVAETHLPEAVKQIRAGKTPPVMAPISVTSHEEIGQLARAVEDMHRQALSLATGEAELRSQVGAMFVTLSRRNNALVNQQLALIESLEQNEEDPKRLEQLFGLDHLATRMRRTAESLVILGGTSGRTVGFEELTVSDAVHAAVSEVTDYQRVVIESVTDRRIVGRSASDVVHLLAELLDNALSYSPPASKVWVRATHSEDGTGVVIRIVDSGLGMAGADLSAANEALRNGGEVTVDTARRMGLFVVSRLAEEHRLSVTLRRNTEGGGITAEVLLPSAALVALEQPAQLPSLLDEPVEQPEEATSSAFVASEVIAAPARVVESEETDPYLDRIEEAIAAVTGLPRRSPSRYREPEPLSDLSVSMFDPAPPLELVPPAEPESELEPQLESLSESLPEPLPEPLTVDGVVLEDTESVVEDSDEENGDESDAATDEETGEESVVEAEQGGRADEQEAEAPAVHAADQHDEVQDEPEPPRLTIRRPLVAVAASSALDADDFDDDEEFESPIFGSLASNWLSDQSGQVGHDQTAGDSWTDPAVDAGWQAAQQSDVPDTSRRTTTGLPVRRPGGHLVPGAVAAATTQEPVAAVRDPEAIRNRLAAHSAGVSRGRAAASAQPITDDYAHEETGPA